MAFPLTIKVFKGGDQTASQDFQQEIIKIGRTPSVHLRLSGEKVSPLHSIIEVDENGALSIVHLGGVEGTFLNGKRVTRSPVTFGDEIRVGEFTLRIEPQRDDSESDQPSDVTLPSTTNRSVPPSQISLQPQSPRSYGPLGLGLRFRWGDRIIGEFLLPARAAKPFSIGTAPGVDFFADDLRLQGPKFEVIRFREEGFELRFTGKMPGILRRNGAAFSFQELIEADQVPNDGEAYTLALDGNDVAAVELGSVILEVAFRPLPKPVIASLLETLDFAAVNVFLVVLFFGALFVATVLNRDLNDRGYLDGIPALPNRISTFTVTQPHINPFIRFLDQIGSQQPDSVSGVPEANAGPQNPTPGARGASRAKRGPVHVLEGILGLTTKVISSIGTNGWKHVLNGVVNGTVGVGPADASSGPGGMRWGGPGTGSNEPGSSVGTGPIGTRGWRNGPGGYGEHVGDLHRKKSAEIQISPGPTTIEGSLDKELIRRVIHDNRGGIRACYESAMMGAPTLSGKVSVRFVIGSSGSVSSSQIVDSTVDNPELEGCVADHVRSWVFPSPKGGGKVIVTYPFLFKPSGE